LFSDCLGRPTNETSCRSFLTPHHVSIGYFSNRAPWLKDAWFFGSSYIIPNVDTVVLGGTADKGDWDTCVRLEDTKRIIDNIAKLMPSIRDAPIVSVLLHYMALNVFFALLCFVLFCLALL
jgi:hypothetical protein